MVNWGAFAELLLIPAPMKFSAGPVVPEISNEYAGAAAFSCIVPMVMVPLEIRSAVVFDPSKMAIPVGTAAGVQLEASFRMFEDGVCSHVASWPCAAAAVSAAATATAMASR